MLLTMMLACRARPSTLLRLRGHQADGGPHVDGGRGAGVPLAGLRVRLCTHGARCRCGCAHHAGTRSAPCACSHVPELATCLCCKAVTRSRGLPQSPVTLTEAAAARIKELLEKRQKVRPQVACRCSRFLPLSHLRGDCRRTTGSPCRPHWDVWHKLLPDLCLLLAFAGLPEAWHQEAGLQWPCVYSQLLRQVRERLPCF